MQIGILAHPRRQESIPIAREVAAIVAARGLPLWMRETWAEEDIPPLMPDTQMLVAIGGDGAMLRAARLGAPHAVPVFGLNAGYLGFLTEANPEDWETCLDRILEGKHWIESRLMITGEVWRAGERIYRQDALNDVVVSRGAAAHLIRLDSYVENDWITSYNADGLIIATPTGSTAYALAVGGPILPPDLNNILMIPVAPHLSMERPVVLSQGVMLRLVVPKQSRAECVVSVDGRDAVPLEIGDEVRVYACQHRGLFVRLQGRNYFFRSLMDRMEPRFLPRHPLERPNGEQPNSI
ncbi:MAG: NAD(+)/NADH kinase [Anaerolineae bacterium]|nr:NAD(+)/NADH kinase [Anaerolineae bacterium]